LIGKLPTLEEVKSFGDDKRLNKRALLINQLLERPEFADYWSLKWSELLRVKSEFPINLWPNAAQAYHRWIHASLVSRMPMDRFARELLTASGSNFRDPPVNFFRAIQDKSAKGIASAVALTFMGMRAGGLPKETLENMSVFFSCVAYKVSRYAKTGQGA